MNPNGTAATAVQKSTLLIFVSLRNDWKIHTPTRLAMLDPNRTRPRNSGPTPVATKQGMSPAATVRRSIEAENIESIVYTHEAISQAVNKGYNHVFKGRIKGSIMVVNFERSWQGNMS